MTKDLRKRILVRSKHRNIFNKNRNMETGVNISVNAIFAKIFYEKQKRVSIKTLMKNKYLITKYPGKRLSLPLVTRV